MSRISLLSLAAWQLVCLDGVVAWAPAARTTVAATPRLSFYASPALFSSSNNDNNAEEETPDTARATFDQAGASLIEEEDRKRMEEMGDYDSNESYQDEAVEKMRAAIRERTAGLGIEKSKVTADYIAQKEKTARDGGPPGAQTNPDQFGGLDLTQISTVKQTTSDWDEELPTMFYDAADDLTKEEQEEVDPVMLKNPIEQGLNELSNAKWPDSISALREVVLMLAVIAMSTFLVTNWDTILRTTYTSLGFIPTADDITNYASRFDGLDLPSGWTDGMSDGDVQSYSDTVAGSMPGL